MKNPSFTLTSAISSQTLNKRKHKPNLYDTTVGSSKADFHGNKFKKHIKPIFGKTHERTKSSLKMYGESVFQTFEGLVRSLINFKTDLLGLKHNERYSSETENLVKLIQKYMDKCTKIQSK